MNRESCGCGSPALYLKAVCAPRLIPFSPGSPLCQTAGEIDLWVKRAFLGMVIYWTGREETWWFTDRFSDSHTPRCTQTNTNVLLAMRGNFYEKSWSIEVTSTAECSKDLFFFFFFTLQTTAFSFPHPCFFLSYSLTHKEAFCWYNMIHSITVSQFCAMRFCFVAVQPYRLFEFIHFVLKASEGNVSKQHKTTYVSSTD